MEHIFYGEHVLAEFFGIQDNIINDAYYIKDIISHAVSECKLTIVRIECEIFFPNGLTVFALLKESHIAIHTYPEHNAMFIDVFTCGKHNPQLIIEYLSNELAPMNKHVCVIERGKYPE